MKRVGYAAFVLGVALLAALMLRTDWPVLLQALKSLGPGGLLVMIAFHLPVIAAGGVAWWYFGRGVRGATLAGFVRARLVRDSVAVALPFSQVGGFLAGLRALAAEGLPAVYCGLSMVADMLAEFAALLPYVAIGVVTLFVLAPRSGVLGQLATGLSAMAGLAIVAFVVRRQIPHWIRASMSATARQFTKTGPGAFPDIDEGFGKILLSRRPLAANLALHFGRWAIGAAETWVAFLLMGVPVSFGNALVIDSITAGLRVFAFMVPGAIGVQEGLYVLVGGLVGLPPSIALAFSLAWRARDMLIGFLGLAVWHSVESSAQTRRNGSPLPTNGSQLQNIS
jgi:putative membrane protein